MTGKILGRKQVSLEDKIAQLMLADTYSQYPRRIDAIETHMSWIFLTDNFAYKLKKPVRYDFLDFTTLEDRQHDCGEEVRLNRRLVQDVYLGVVPLIIDDAGKMSVGGHGEIIDWLVKMRRLPANRMLDFMIKHKTLQETDVRNVASLLATFYQKCLPVDVTAKKYRQAHAQQVSVNMNELAEPCYGFPESQLKVIHDALYGFLECESELFGSRAAQGKIVEGHGDLRPEHICLEPLPVIFDCLEFNYSFRIVDSIDELSSLAMECDLLGAPNVGLLLFDIYGEICDDRPPQRLINFYKSHRACLRTKLAIRHIQELDPSAWPSWRNSANDYLLVAEQYARQLL